MLSNIFNHWNNNINNNNYMDLCNVYSSNLLQNNSNISSSLVFFIESLTFINLNQISVVSILNYPLFSTVAVKVIFFLLLSSFLFLVFGF